MENRLNNILIKNKRLVSVIIVNQNGKKYLEKCLTSLKNQGYKNIEIILVDNASIDDSVDFTKKIFPDAKIKINSENLGFAEPNNIGYNLSEGDYVLFLNNDTEVKKDFLHPLVSILESNKDVGGVQSKILFMDNPTVLDSVGAFLTYSGILYYYGI